MLIISMFFLSGEDDLGMGDDHCDVHTILVHTRQSTGLQAIRPRTSG